MYQHVRRSKHDWSKMKSSALSTTSKPQLSFCKHQGLDLRLESIFSLAYSWKVHSSLKFNVSFIINTINLTYWPSISIYQYDRNLQGNLRTFCARPYTRVPRPQRLGRWMLSNNRCRRRPNAILNALSVNGILADCLGNSLLRRKSFSHSFRARAASKVRLRAAYSPSGFPNQTSIRGRRFGGL